MSSLELNITNTNARSLTSMAKGLYSCKNILKRGKKRELIRSFLQTKPQQKSKGFSEISCEISQWRILLSYEDSEKPAEN